MVIMNQTCLLACGTRFHAAGARPARAAGTGTLALGRVVAGFHDQADAQWIVVKAPLRPLQALCPKGSHRNAILNFKLLIIILLITNDSKGKYFSKNLNYAQATIQNKQTPAHTFRHFYTLELPVTTNCAN
jgi:hypothetical protein